MTYNILKLGRKREIFMEKATEKNEKTTTTFGAFIEESVKLGKNVKIYPNVYLLGNTIIGDNTTIYPGTTIIDSCVGAGCEIKNSYIENSEIEDLVNIGPFAHLRPNSKIKSGARIGNFVEIKNSNIGKNTKVSHLAYVGDADVGNDCNIGCGAIFVNYNGKTKSRTKVGDNCFIGSNCNVIAPVVVSDKTYLCAGTTLATNTEYDDFVIGRVRETIKKNRAHQYLGE